jgi:membrane-bound inhibitor of C-type lysozyme
MLHKKTNPQTQISHRIRLYRQALVLGIALMGLNGCASLPFFGHQPAVTQTDTVFTGRLNYTARIALPPDSSAVIKLYDGKQPDQLITEEHIPLHGKQVPIAFKVHIAKGGLALDHPYLLQTYLASKQGILWYSTPITVTTAKQQLGEIKLKLFNDQGITTAFTCGKTPVEITNRGDQLTMMIKGETITLLPAISASGARYVAKNDPDTVFWSKGTHAMITLHGHDLANCVEKTAEKPAY